MKKYLFFISVLLWKNTNQESINKKKYLLKVDM